MLLEMRANRATTAAMPSPTSTHSTACTVPRSSPLLSSSFTPFYPRSQQQLYPLHPGYVGPHDGGCQASVQHSNDIDASQSHFSSWSHVRGPKYYDPQYYTSMGAEPYEVSWMPNGGAVWDGGAWQQWGDPVEYAYAEDDTGDSANLFSDAVSYYADSPTLEQDISACFPSNTTSIPVLLSNRNTQFLDGHIIEGSESDVKTSSSITDSTIVSNVFHSGIVPGQASCSSKKLKESFRELIEKEVSVYGQGLSKDERKEVIKEFAGSKLDLNSPFSEASMQMCSGFKCQTSEVKSTTGLVENVQAQKEGNLLHKASYILSKESGSSDAIDARHSICVTSETIEPIDNPDLKSSTVSLATDTNQGEFRSMKSVSHHTSMQPNNRLSHSMELPKPVDFQPFGQMNDLEGFHQEKLNSCVIQPEDVGLCSNEPHLLVECIHNLCKVLSSSQSKASSINALNSSDCLVLENIICMLSHRLFQRSAIEANSCKDSNCQQEEKNSNDSKGFVEPHSLQKAADQFASMKTVFSFKRNVQDEVLQNAPQSTCTPSLEGENQSSDLLNHLQVLQEELRVLRGVVQNLQEELGYERDESNTTVSIYKDLWSESQEALKVCRSEIKEIRTELAGLKQELTNLKLSGATHKECEIYDDYRTSFKQEENGNVVTSSRQGVMASDLSRALTEEVNNTSCGSSKKNSRVLTGYFDPGIRSNCISTGKPFVMFAKAESKNSDQATPLKHRSKNCESSNSKSSLNTITPPMNIENDVAQRLSLLLSRQCLDLNKACTESSMEWSSGSHTLEPSSNLPGEDEAMLPKKNYLIWSETPCLVNDDNGSGCSTFNLSCQRRRVSEEEEDCLYGFMEDEPHDGGMDAAELKEGDEIEIICFKPGIGDSNFTCLKGEPEWEDVVVNALDDHRSTREEMA